MVLAAAKRAEAWRAWLGLDADVQAQRRAYAALKAEQLPDVTSAGAADAGDPLSGLLGEAAGGGGRDLWAAYHANV